MLKQTQATLFAADTAGSLVHRHCVSILVKISGTSPDSNATGQPLSCINHYCVYCIDLHPIRYDLLCIDLSWPRAPHARMSLLLSKQPRKHQMRKRSFPTHQQFGGRFVVSSIVVMRPIRVSVLPTTPCSERDVYYCVVRMAL